MNRYIEEMVARRPELSACADDIQRVFEALAECFRGGGKLLVCGNGGSAADAEHITGELLKGFHSKRPLSEEMRSKVGPELAGCLQGALPAIPLTSFTSLSTAFCNDVAAEPTFAQLTLALGRQGDALLGISTSGNAKNVLLAMRVARAVGMRTIGLSGRNGGALASAAELCIRVPESQTDRIQELHLPVYHCLCSMLEEEFFGPGK